MSFPSCARLLIGLVVPCLGLSTAHAAGGQFDVDDASVLEPGHCQVETWVFRAPAASQTLFHVGPSCRTGPVEVGLNLDRSMAGDARTTAIGPQLKIVADPLIERLSVGLAWSASFDAVHGGRPWQTLVAPLTWWVGEKFWLHANLGADWTPEGEHVRRLGASAEWAALDALSLFAERITIAHDWRSRAGVRFNFNESTSLDLSAARVGATATRLYGIGLNHDFTR